MRFEHPEPAENVREHQGIAKVRNEMTQFHLGKATRVGLLQGRERLGKGFPSPSPPEGGICQNGEGKREEDFEYLRTRPWAEKGRMS